MVIDNVGVDSQGLSIEFVKQINMRLYEGLNDFESAGKFTKGRGEVFTSMIEWLDAHLTAAEPEIDRVTIAALAHMVVYFIHVFKDGNTRTSQLVQNYILLNSGYPPSCIPTDEFTTYQDLFVTIESMGSRDPRPFVRFIYRSLLYTMAKLEECVVKPEYVESVQSITSIQERRAAVM
uniref:Fido domain-containing protein n=1 Tax=Ditylenchus dipsaci TaxID=166011 RepID=A0A915D0Z6_9BILA